MSPQPGFLGREKQEERREGLLPSLHLGVELGSPSHYASLFSEGNHSKELQKRLCCRAVCGLVLGTSDRCLPTMLRGCQICWAFRSMPRTEQLLQWQCNSFPLEHFTNGLMGLDSMAFLEDFRDTTVYTKMKVVFWGKRQVANLRWRRYSINLVSTRLSINFKW